MERKILILDDFRVSNEILQNILVSAGYKVYCSQDGHEALKLLSTISFDAIITDLNMPGMSGIEFIDKVKGLSTYRNIPIIVLSSIENDKLEDEQIKPMITAWIKKPVKHELILKTMHKVFFRDNMVTKEEK